LPNRQVLGVRDGRRRSGSRPRAAYRRARAAIRALRFPFGQGRRIGTFAACAGRVTAVTLLMRTRGLRAGTSLCCACGRFPIPVAESTAGTMSLGRARSLAFSLLAMAFRLRRLTTMNSVVQQRQASSLPEQAPSLQGRAFKRGDGLLQMRWLALPQMPRKPQPSIQSRAPRNSTQSAAVVGALFGYAGSALGDVLGNSASSMRRARAADTALSDESSALNMLQSNPILQIPTPAIVAGASDLGTAVGNAPGIVPTGLIPPIIPGAYGATPSPSK